MKINKYHFALKSFIKHYKSFNVKSRHCSDGTINFTKMSRWHFQQLRMREKRKMIAIYKNNTGFEIPKGSIVVVDSKNKYIKSLEPPNWKKLLDACGFKPCHMCYLNKQAYRYTYE